MCLHPNVLETTTTIISECMYVCIYVNTYVCIYIYVYIDIGVYIYIFTFKCIRNNNHTHK